MKRAREEPDPLRPIRVVVVMLVLVMLLYVLDMSTRSGSVEFRCSDLLSGN